MPEPDVAAKREEAPRPRAVVDASVETVRAELRKVAENMRYRAECQVTACGFWGNFQLFIGGAAAVSAAVAGASAFSEQSVVAGVFAVAASVLSATLATVKAGERAALHERSANELNLLSEGTLRYVELTEKATSAATLGETLQTTIAQRDEIVRRAPFVNRRLCRLADTFLAHGQSYFGSEANAAAGERARAGLMRRLWHAWRSPRGSVAPPRS